MVEYCFTYKFWSMILKITDYKIDDGEYFIDEFEISLECPVSSEFPHPSDEYAEMFEKMLLDGEHLQHKIMCLMTEKQQVEIYDLLESDDIAMRQELAVDRVAVAYENGWIH